MTLPPPISTLTDTRFPYTTLFRSHGRKPDLVAVGKLIHMRCAVADRRDVGQARLAERVDAYAVGAIGARRDQRLDRRNDADADDDEIGRNDLAVRQAHEIGRAHV